MLKATRGEFKTLVFFDLETTDLFNGPDQQDPRVPPRTIPGDANRDVAQIFKTYADTFDNSNEYRLPRITEISLVAVPRRVYKEGVDRVHAKYVENGQKKGDLKMNLPSRVLVQQINPELTEAEWKVYDQKQRSVAGFHLKRSDLECQQTFRQAWTLIHSFLSSLEAPAVLIAHNGLRFDCRVLLCELRRTGLLESYPIPTTVYFMDSYLAFLDLEKRYHEEIQAVMSSINWKMITEVVMRKRPSLEPDPREAARKRTRQNELKGAGDRQVVTITSTDSDDLCDGPESAQQPSTSDLVPIVQQSNLKRAAYTDRDSPPRDCQALPNEGWRSAPAKLVPIKFQAEDYSQANPLNFMKIDMWSPAKRWRLRNEFFERKDDGDWNFSVPMVLQYFNARGNFRLIKLYTDVINGLYAEHHAYDDCVALLNVCLAFGDEFLAYVDRTATHLEPLNSV